MKLLGSNFLCGHPLGADPSPIHMHPPEPDSLPNPCGRHKWMAPNTTYMTHILFINAHVYM